IWGKHRNAFGNLARAPFLLLWFTVLLMPLTMFTSAAALMILYGMHSPQAWSVLRYLWIWAAISYAASISMSLAIDWRTAKACWVEALLFPGVIALVIMAYSVFPALFEVTFAQWLAQAGLVLSPAVRTGLGLFIYAWMIICVPLAYVAKMCSEKPKLQ